MSLVFHSYTILPVKIQEHLEMCLFHPNRYYSVRLYAFLLLHNLHLTLQKVTTDNKVSNFTHLCGCQYAWSN